MADVWVLEPVALPAFIEREAPIIAPADIALVAYHLRGMYALKSRRPVEGGVELRMGQAVMGVLCLRST